jgi:hypothetical protein
MNGPGLFVATLIGLSASRRVDRRDRARSLIHDIGDPAVWRENDFLGRIPTGIGRPGRPVLTLIGVAVLVSRGPRMIRSAARRSA